MQRQTPWDLTGYCMKGLYLGFVPYSGTVESSRVRLGGTIVHCVILDSPIKVYGARRDRILVTDWEIDSVTVNYEIMA